jgi:8-oxo-dGTP diphosphatase
MERTENVTLTNMCMIYDDKGNVLVEEKVGKNYKGLIFPGGHIEKDEPIVDSVIREIYEETRLTISNLKMCGVKDWITEERNRYIVFLYKTSTYSGNIQSSSEGKVFWMPLEKLTSKEPFWHMDKMLDLFCGSEYSELYLEGEHGNRTPILK